MRAFVVLGLLFSIPSPEIGLGERIRNDLFCFEWDIKPQLNQSVSRVIGFKSGVCHGMMWSHHCLIPLARGRVHISRCGAGSRIVFQQLVKPRCGRVIGFESSVYHGMTPLKSGRRCVLLASFTVNYHQRELAHLQAETLLRGGQAR